MTTQEQIEELQEKQKELIKTFDINSYDWDKWTEYVEALTTLQEQINTLIANR